ncbi:hypothetical protein JF73_03710 [Lactobacillus helsingborgensis]|uniref:RNase H type-1 domain-containing protein n=1 Tax=Lactobacillus helsingborgensis TaxID=1218494 RepID=A0AA47B4J2_9LACO|nr:hypothetical protein [Lactobacillus helsingborgensis]KJY65799.1 hypothetical protein JF73_03710 [Lactobacillus helsingborgensis]UZX30013.1 hypothetical protein LDX53_01930 [Lactobacillus helsingborgensis]
MSESEENKKLKEKYSKDNYFAIIYLKGGCSNGNTKISSRDTSAWMYYIEFPSSRKNIQVNDKSHANYVLEATTMKSQNRMTLEVMKEAMKEAINLGINKNKLLFVTDYNDLAKGINSWSKKWLINGFRNSKGNFIVDKDLWKNLIDTYDQNFPNSEVLFLVKGKNTDLPQFKSGMQIVTDFVNSRTEFNK